MTNDEIDIYMEDFVENRLTFDVYDIKYRNDALMNYDVEDKLKKIKAKSLIFRSKQDLYFSIEHDLLPLKELIKDCEIVLYESDEQDFEYQNPAIVKNEIMLFLKDIAY
jgi:homoserine O-acetyltransferase